MVSPGCANCYAKSRDDRQMIEPVSHWGKGAPRRKSKSAVKAALAMNRSPWICECGQAFSMPSEHLLGWTHCPNQTFHRRRVFSLSLGDWLDDEVPIEWLAEMLDTIQRCNQVTWILCTKRPENWLKRMQEAQKTGDREDDLSLHKVSSFGHCVASDWIAGSAPKNIIVMTSVENQEMADKRIPELVNIPAVCRGLSIEPLLGPIDLHQAGAIFTDEEGDLSDPNPTLRRSFARSDLGWVIIGGESGKNARPCNVDWIRSLVEQGQAAGVATFVKQLGFRPLTDEATPDGWPVGTELVSRTKENAVVSLRDKKGGNPEEWPKDLRVREWPKGF